MNKYNNTFKFGHLVTIAASFGLLTACSQLRDMKEMHDATGEMRDTTKEMNAQTKTMGANTEEMKASTKEMEQLTKALSVKTEDLKRMTAELYRAAKQGTSMALREEILKKIVASESQAEKLSKAAKYFMAFEYQIWSGAGPDTEESRAELTASAAREFMREIQRFIHPDTVQVFGFGSPEVAAKMKADPMLAALAPATELSSNINSFAVALHSLNPVQESLIASKVVSKVSMYSMIQDAFLANKEIEEGRKQPNEYPKYVNEVRSFLGIAEILVRARTNALSAMALARLSKLATAEKPFLELQAMKSAWTLQTEKLNSQEIRDASTFLKGAIETRDFMNKVGLSPKDIKDQEYSAHEPFTNAQPSDEMKAARDAAANAKAGSGGVNERQAALAELSLLVEAYAK